VENIEETLQNIPQNPGVYMMKSTAGDTLYIGKALNLKNRVSSYFANEDKTRFQIPHLLVVK